MLVCDGHCICCINVHPHTLSFWADVFMQWNQPMKLWVAPKLQENPKRCPKSRSQYKGILYITIEQCNFGTRLFLGRQIRGYLANLELGTIWVQRRPHFGEKGSSRGWKLKMHTYLHLNFLSWNQFEEENPKWKAETMTWYITFFTGRHKNPFFFWLVSPLAFLFQFG
jgi:hypothetical protein